MVDLYQHVFAACLHSNSINTTLSAVFTDTLPAGLVVANPSALTVSGCALASVTAVTASGSISYATGATIPPGGCTISVSVTANTTGIFTNTLAVAALKTSFGNNPVAASATLSVTPGASLSVSKTNGTTTLVAGSTTTYTIVVSNAGPSAADNTLVQDRPSAGLNCLNGTLTCTPAGSALCSVVLSVQSFVQGGTPGTGLLIPQLPGGGSVSFALTCSVIATGQ